MDLKNAFYHMPMAWTFHVFDAFVVDGQTYIFEVLPFVLSVAPLVFSRITKPFKVHLHFYSTVFKLSRLWNIRFRASFLFFGSLVSEFTSPGLTLHNPRQSSTWVWFYT